MNPFKHSSFRTKLLALCVLMSAVSMIIATVSYQGLADVGDSYSQITEQVMPKLESANEMFAEYRGVRIALRTLALPGITKEQSAEAVASTLAAVAAYEKADATYVGYGHSEGQKELYEAVHSSWETFKEVGEKVLAHHRSDTLADREAILKIFFDDCPKAATAYAAAITKLLEFHKSSAHRRSEESKNLAARAKLLFLAVGGIGILSGLFIGVFLANSISNSISKITRNLSDSVLQISSASTQIASSSGVISQATTEQASSLEQTASSLEEITAMIAKASESADAAALSSTSSQKTVDQGRYAVDQMLISMGEISQSNVAIMNKVSESNDQISEIVHVIQEIGNKTKVINEIVFQTKLLSFNASVEAARAGEHGKGFAVVAEEVGTLAQMSGNAAKEISVMLESSIAKVEKIVSETKTGVTALVDDGKRKVESGVTVANQCSDLLKEIVKNVSHVAELAKEISVAGKEQALGVHEINKAMGQLDSVTNQNATKSQEAAMAAGELSNQTEILNGIATKLRITVQGKVAA